MSYLKLRDETVLEFDLNEGDFLIHNPQMLPFSLRDNMVDSREHKDYRSFVRNYQVLMNFFHGRCLSIQRKNAKAILNALHLPQKDDDDSVTKIMILCKALSVTDDYWLSNNPNEKWDDVNLKNNPLHEVIAQIALTGVKALTITGNIRTPECTAQGVYAKAWKRENGELYLYKASTTYGHESEIEAEVSDILDYTNVPHVHYDFLKDNGLRLSKCASMCTDAYSIVPSDDVFAWCNRTGRNFDQLIASLDQDMYYKTMVVDYLISNSDRHAENWGFYMDNRTGQLIGLHPLFDHNNAFDKNEMKMRDGGDSLMIPGKNKLDCAKFAIKRCSFKLDPKIPKNVFLNQKHFDSFCSRAAQLNIRVNAAEKNR